MRTTFWRLVAVPAALALEGAVSQGPWPSPETALAPPGQIYEYDEQLARQSLIYSSAAYQEEPEVAAWAFVNSACNNATQGFILNETYNSADTQAFGFVGVDPVGGYIVAAFKGTSGLRDWVTDLSTWLRYSYECALGSNGTDIEDTAAAATAAVADTSSGDDTGCGGVGGGSGASFGVSTGGPAATLPGHVHHGFCEFYASLAELGLAARVAALAGENPGYAVLLSGHSLGGAAATIAAADLSLRWGLGAERLLLYTLGEPRVGDVGFAEGLNSAVGTRYRLVHRRDVVPHLAPCCHDWRAVCKAEEHCPYHHGGEVVYNNDMAVSDSCTVCSPTVGEDKECGPGAVSLSVMDHLYYFQQEVGAFCGMDDGSDDDAGGDDDAWPDDDDPAPPEGEQGGGGGGHSSSSSSSSDSSGGGGDDGGGNSPKLVGWLRERGGGGGDRGSGGGPKFVGWLREREGVTGGSADQRWRETDLLLAERLAAARRAGLPRRMASESHQATGQAPAPQAHLRGAKAQAPCNEWRGVQTARELLGGHGVPCREKLKRTLPLPRLPPGELAHRRVR